MASACVAASGQSAAVGKAVGTRGRMVGSRGVTATEEEGQSAAVGTEAMGTAVAVPACCWGRQACSRRCPD